MGTEILILRFGYSLQNAGAIVTIPYLFIGIMMIPVGILGDFLGDKKQLIVVLSGFFMFFATLLPSTLPQC
jgi:MFS family permease